jgi:hypothetical protein
MAADHFDKIGTYMPQIILIQGDVIQKTAIQMLRE